MTFSWEDAEGGTATDAEKIPVGQHYVKVEKIITESKSGGPFKSRDGDPKIMVVFTDADGREAAQMYTLSEKAAWTLAILLSRIGATKLSELDQQGIKPSHFANKKFAESHLLGKFLWASVYYETGTDNKQYIRVDPLKPDEVHDVHAKPEPVTVPAQEDDVPF